MTVTPVVRLGDTLIAVQRTDSDQQILIQATPQGEGLARLLTGGEEPARQDGFFAVSHSRDVDNRLVDLIDALIDIRWMHPTYTQLIVLNEEGQQW